LEVPLPLSTLFSPLIGGHNSFQLPKYSLQVTDVWSREPWPSGNSVDTQLPCGPGAPADGSDDSEGASGHGSPTTTIMTSRQPRLRRRAHPCAPSAAPGARIWRHVPPTPLPPRERLQTPFEMTVASSHRFKGGIGIFLATYPTDI
jgi:hypothetical protein